MFFFSRPVSSAHFWDHLLGLHMCAAHCLLNIVLMRTCALSTSVFHFSSCLAKKVCSNDRRPAEGQDSCPIESITTP